GETMTYEALLTFQDNVTLPPELTLVGDAVKLAMAGAAPCGTLDAVYTGFIWTTSNAEAGTCPRLCRSSLSQRLSGAPLMYIALPLSAMIRPYFFMAFRITCM